MMDALYNSTAAQVTSIIKKYGATLKVSYASGKTVSTYGVWGKTKESEGQEGLIGNISVMTKEMYVPALSVDPAVGDTITFNKKVYSIDAVDVYQPTTIPIAYKLTVSA